jgi:hypothetical protein
MKVASMGRFAEALPSQMGERRVHRRLRALAETLGAVRSLPARSVSDPRCQQLAPHTPRRQSLRSSGAVRRRSHAKSARAISNIRIVALDGHCSGPAADRPRVSGPSLGCRSRRAAATGSEGNSLFRSRRYRRGGVGNGVAIVASTLTRPIYSAGIFPTCRQTFRPMSLAPGWPLAASRLDARRWGCLRPHRPVTRIIVRQSRLV